MTPEPQLFGSQHFADEASYLEAEETDYLEAEETDELLWLGMGWGWGSDLQLLEIQPFPASLSLWFFS